MGVTGLPRALAPWARSLGLFPEELSLALAPLVERLHVLLGPAGRSAGETGEPDGYDGVARRGTYERLLGTEWLLLSEVPEEFLRRAVTGEHSFLRTAHRPPAGGRISAVLFDAGPDQLGAPRILHMAALIVMAARVERLRGSLLWGVLQDETVSLQSRVGRGGLRALVESRSKRPASPGDVERWLGDERVAGASERWIVGAEDLRPAGKERIASALVVSDVLSPGVRRLHVSARAAGAAAPREAELDLPEERECVRLLRAPFGHVARAPQQGPVRLDPSGGLVFSVSGRRLYAMGEGGRLLSFVIVNSAKAPVPPAAVFEPPAGQRVIAAGIEAKGRTVVVCAGENACFSHRLSHARKTAIESREHRFLEEERPPESGPWPLRRLLLAGSLANVTPGLGSVVLTGYGALRVSIPPCSDHLVLSGDFARWEPPPATPEHGDEQQWNPPVIRVEEAPAERWVDGMMRVDRGAEESPVTLRQGARAVERHGRTGRETLFTTGVPITLIKPVNGRGLLAYLTASGDLGVYSIWAGAQVLFVAGGRIEA